MGLTTLEFYQLNPENNKLECNKCQAKFERGGRVFESHIARCDGVPLPSKRYYQYPCFQCGNLLLSKVTSPEHMALKHKFINENPEKIIRRIRWRTLKAQHGPGHTPDTSGAHPRAASNPGSGAAPADC